MFSAFKFPCLFKSNTGVNFINILLEPFVPIFWRQKITQPKPNLRKAARKTNGKMWPQVSISSTFYVRIFCTNVVLAAFSLVTFCFVAKEKLPKRCSYEKFAHKMLEKLTPGGLVIRGFVIHGFGSQWTMNYVQNLLSKDFSLAYPRIRYLLWTKKTILYKAKNSGPLLFEVLVFAVYSGNGTPANNEGNLYQFY